MEWKRRLPFAQVSVEPVIFLFFTAEWFLGYRSEHNKLESYEYGRQQENYILSQVILNLIINTAQASGSDSSSTFPVVSLPAYGPKRRQVKEMQNAAARRVMFNIKQE